MTDNRFTNRSELIGILVLAVFLVVVLPLCLDVFRLNLVAKYLTYAFVALGLVICWGYGGILSLAQITGLSRTTIRRGVRELRRGTGRTGKRIRQPGGGRPPVEKKSRGW